MIQKQKQINYIFKLLGDVTKVYYINIYKRKNVIIK